jgi:hypothetical protein
VSNAPCGAAHESADVTGIYCELPQGHPGDHEAMRPVIWGDDYG